MDEIYCAVVYDTETQEFTRYNNQNNGQKSIDDLYDDLEYADCIAHYGIGFDFLAMKKLRPDFEFKGRCYDSILIAKLIWPDIRSNDFANQYKPKFRNMPKRLFGLHKLEAWGHRLGDFKDDFNPKNYLDENGKPHTWATVGWSQDMEDYCVQDVVVLNLLCDLIDSKKYSQKAIDLETNFAWLIKRQEMVGFEFNEEAAVEFQNKLMLRSAELKEQIDVYFKPWYAPKGVKFTDKPRRVQDEALGFDYSKPIYARGPSQGLTSKGKPKVGPFLFHSNGDKVIDTYEYKRVHYVGGTSYTKIDLTTFKPTSRDHIADRLIKVYGWKPDLFNEGDGKPTVTEDVLGTVDHPSAVLLTEYLMVSARLGMVATGKQAWLKQVRDGRIYGKVDTLGAITGRCTHSKPNVAQVPASGKPYGSECRALFTVPKGYKLVGADAAGLELRCLGHYMAPYDGGAYALETVEGDVHWKNLLAIGIAQGNRDKSNKAHTDGRGGGKTWTYSYLYGGGVELSGINYIHAYRAYHGESPKGTIEGLGKASRKTFKKNLPALAKLEKDVQKQAKMMGVLKGIDGRFISIRAVYASLNALLQGAGALIMKQALIELEALLQAEGLTNSWQSSDFDYEYVANIHDEFQIQVKEEHAELVARLAEKSMVLAGEYFGFRCRIDGEADIGMTWKDTH